MARKPVRPPPPPSWVWGPSEIDAWIEGAYPAGRRPRRHPARLKRGVDRVRIRFAGWTLAAVRRAAAAAMTGEGGREVVETRGRVHGRIPGGPRAEARIRGSLFRGTYLVTIVFEPPARPALVRGLVRRIRERVEVLAVAESLRP